MVRSIHAQTPGYIDELRCGPYPWAFSGVTSAVPIGRVHYYSLNLAPPNAQNSAIDNVRIGVASPTPVEPATWGVIKTLYR